MSTDPFAGGSHEKVPSLSFKNAAVGTSYTGTVTEAPKLVQSRNFETEEPDFWDKEKTQPKMSVVVRLNVNGEERSIWAQKPSALFRAFADAQASAGKQVEVGDTVTVTFTHEVPNKKNPKLNAAKQYKVEIKAADAFESSDDDVPDFLK